LIKRINIYHKTLKNQKNSKTVVFKIQKFSIFCTPSKKLFGQFMIKNRKISKKPHGSKFREKSDFMGFPRKKRT